MTMLAESFPSLRQAMNGRPFDPDWMEHFAEGAMEGNSHWAAMFVLDVWYSDRSVRAPRFNLIQAMRVWDDDHRNALDEWLMSPFYPVPEPVAPIHLRKRPRRWTAREAINTLWDYLDSFPDSARHLAEQHLSELDGDLTTLEEQAA
jgi:hypothetical protein